MSNVPLIILLANVLSIAKPIEMLHTVSGIVSPSSISDVRSFSNLNVIDDLQGLQP